MILLATTVWAARLTFEDGSILDATITKITPEKIYLNYNSTEIERERAQITSIMDMNEAEEKLLDVFLKEYSKEPVQVAEPVTNFSSEETAITSLKYLKEKLKIKYEEEQKALAENYNKEKSFLEKNLELLAKKHAKLSEDFIEQQQKYSTVSMQLEEQMLLTKKYEQEIINLKQEINYINEARLETDVKTSEKLQEAISKNKKFLDKEKSSLVESYDNHIAELEKQVNESNLKILELGKTNSDLSAKLANAEKLADQNGATLSAFEKRFSSFKEDKDKELAELKERQAKDRMALEQLLAKSAENLGSQKNELKMLQDEVVFLKDKNKTLENEIKAKDVEIEIAQKEKEQYKKDSLEAIKQQTLIREKSKEEKEKLLRTLVDTAVTEGEGDEYSGLKVEAKKILEEAKMSGIEESDATKSALFSLYQQNISNLNAKLNAAAEEIESLKKENASLKASSQNSEFQLKEYERKKKNAEEQVEKLEQEKQELKTEVDQILKDIREETQKELIANKKELRSEFEKAISTLEIKSKEKQESEEVFPEPKQVPVESTPPMESMDLDVKNETPFKTEEKNSENIPDEQPKDNSGETVQPAENNLSQLKLEVGVVSQIESEFSRIFIDTKEVLKENELVYINTEAGEIPFKIIKLYPSLNGAIAETKSKDKMKYIQLKASIYIR